MHIGSVITANDLKDLPIFSKIKVENQYLKISLDGWMDIASGFVFKDTSFKENILITYIPKENKNV